MSFSRSAAITVALNERKAERDALARKLAQDMAQIKRLEDWIAATEALYPESAAKAETEARPAVTANLADSSRTLLQWVVSELRGSPKPLTVKEITRRLQEKGVRTETSFESLNKTISGVVSRGARAGVFDTPVLYKYLLGPKAPDEGVMAVQITLSESIRSTVREYPGITIADLTTRLADHGQTGNVSTIVGQQVRKHKLRRAGERIFPV